MVACRYIIDISGVPQGPHHQKTVVDVLPHSTETLVSIYRCNKHRHSNNSCDAIWLLWSVSHMAYVPNRIPTLDWHFPLDGFSRKHMILGWLALPVIDNPICLHCFMIILLLVVIGLTQLPRHCQET